MSLQTSLLYFVTWSLVALSPGPAVMCAMSQATRFGLRASLAGIAGTQCGNVIFFIATALGLAALLETAGVAFNFLRIAGAVYLAWLGVRLIVATYRRPAVRAAAEPSSPPAARGLFLQGLLIQLTNPKALLFVSALLPQFIKPGQPLLPQLLVLSFITIAVDCVVLSSYAFFAERGARSLRRSGLVAWLERILGAALVLFGIRLLLSRK